MTYRVEILTVPGYPHSPRVFQETADAFEGALKDLGMWAADGVPIVFGAHLIEAKVPEGAIIYQTEVCSSPWMGGAYFARLLQHRVLDYAESNVAWLKSMGCDATYCPIGYHRSLTRLTLQEPEVDVLFYGAITERRAPILDAVSRTGLKRVFLTHDSDWGRRDYWLPRTKILLNIHAYDNAPLETVRLSYALANKVFVVTEGPVPPEMAMVVPQARPEDIARICESWVSYKLGRHVGAAMAFDIFSGRTQADILRSVLT